MINLTYKFNFMIFNVMWTDICFKNIFKNPTPSRKARRRSSVNSVLALSLLPFAVPDVICRIQNTTD